MLDAGQQWLIVLGGEICACFGGEFGLKIFVNKVAIDGISLFASCTQDGSIFGIDLLQACASGCKQCNMMWLQFCLATCLHKVLHLGVSLPHVVFKFKKGELSEQSVVI